MLAAHGDFVGSYANVAQTIACYVNAGYRTFGRAADRVAA